LPFRLLTVTVSLSSQLSSPFFFFFFFFFQAKESTSEMGPRFNAVFSAGLGRRQRAAAWAVAIVGAVRGLARRSQTFLVRLARG
jgi:hypothetical protein